MDAQPAQPSTRSLEGYLAAIASLLQQVIRHGGFEVRFALRKAEVSPQDFEAPEFVVDFAGPDADLLLERHAALLNALEYMVLRAVRLDEDLFGKITFDCQDWRRVRAQELKLTAQVAAQRVVETGEPFPLSPMNARERRIVHLALKDQPLVRTVSEGFGPERKVIIHPAASSPRSPRR